MQVSLSLGTGHHSGMGYWILGTLLWRGVLGS